MRHFVLIRASYSNEPLSSTRLGLSVATIIPSLKAQIDRNFEVIVRVSPKDPNLAARKAAFEKIGVRVRFTDGEPGPWSEVNDAFHLSGSWNAVIGKRSDRVLQTRVDDDDALARSFMARIHRANRHTDRRIYTFPRGYVTDGTHIQPRHYPGNQFLTLATPPGSSEGVYDKTHNDLTRRPFKNVQVVDTDPAWLWIRHPDAISIKAGRSYTVTKEITPHERSLFVIDWGFIAAQGSTLV